MKQTLQSRLERKLRQLNTNIELVLDYELVDEKDTYGFYLTNKTTKSKIKGLPMIGSFVDIYPDFFVLETEPGLFMKTNNTCLCWFKEENHIDTLFGLYNAIKYKETELLRFYKGRFSGIKYFSPIDYSLCGDFDEDTLVHNIKRQCITYLWFTFEMKGIAFPLMTYGNEDSLEWCFEHIMVGSNVIVSLKMVMTGPEKDMFLKALRVLVDTIKPKALLIYTVAKHESSMELLKYAVDNGVRIIEISNTLMNKNRGVGNG